MSMDGKNVLFKVGTLSEEPFRGLVLDKILILSSPNTFSTSVHAFVVESLADESYGEIFIIPPGDIMKISHGKI